MSDRLNIIMIKLNSVLSKSNDSRFFVNLDILLVEKCSTRHPPAPVPPQVLFLQYCHYGAHYILVNASDVL